MAVDLHSIASQNRVRNGVKSGHGIHKLSGLGENLWEKDGISLLWISPIRRGFEFRKGEMRPFPGHHSTLSEVLSAAQSWFCTFTTSVASAQENSLAHPLGASIGQREFTCILSSCWPPEGRRSEE